MPSAGTGVSVVLAASSASNRRGDTCPRMHPLSLPLLLGSLCAQGVLTGSHSMRYFKTRTSEPIAGAPEFYIVGYVDESPIGAYDNLSREYLPRAQWMAENFGPQFWERETQIAKGWQENFKVSMKILMDRYNQSRGLHTFQVMYGCELGPDGSTQGFMQFGYDGHDFIRLDKERLTWVGAMRGAEITERTWNADRSIAEHYKAYLEQDCIDLLQKCVGYGEKELDKKVRPELKLWDKSDGVWTTLHSQVTGFYPHEIEVKWVKNGQVTMQGTVTTGILPNHDGTYQIQVSVDIDPQEEATYDCHVDHSSLQEPLRVLWEPKASPPIGIIIGAIVAVLLVMAGVLGVVTWKKKRQASDRKDESFSSSGDSSMSI
ncbi:major histocompatibility complex class I-related gene protein-like [Rhinatrema bivittatum]|uniref:major histocompatibility complex class I-related gene protein-like n=1 Tax=Rhinatrema bivittatum TaxID=194408 RepID=UPI001129945E|nr:major histocompatibility complex class I-related gene protein-like [Rhinatrema bivittatum]